MFLRQFPASFSLSGVQSTILLSIALQKKTVEAVAAELNLPVNQVLALLMKVVKKCAGKVREIWEMMPPTGLAGQGDEMEVTPVAGPSGEKGAADDVPP